jgi:hypothetical protein
MIRYFNPLLLDGVDRLFVMQSVNNHASVELMYPIKVK